MNRMKIEEAIFYLKNTPVIASNADKETVQKAYDMTIEALEKQIPKKTVEGYRFPEKLRKAILNWENGDICHQADEKAPCCPSCGQPQRISEIIKKREGVEIGNPYCWKCGQALKWGEQE